VVVEVPTILCDARRLLVLGRVFFEVTGAEIRDREVGLLATVATVRSLSRCELPAKTDTFEPSQLGRQLDAVTAKCQAMITAVSLELKNIDPPALRRDLAPEPRQLGVP
jgi:hypothetical protein